MEMPARSPEAAAQDQVRASLYDAMAFAAEWFQNRLAGGSGRTLAFGPGHLSASALPGDAGNKGDA